MPNTKLTMQSSWCCSDLQDWRPFSKWQAEDSEIVKQNSRILYPLPLTMTTITLSSLILRVRSFKLGHSAMLPSSHQARKAGQRIPLLLNAFPLKAFPESIIFKPRPTELLMLCLVTDLPVARTRQMQLQMPCLVGLQERPLGPPVSKLCPHGFEPRFHVSEPCSHVFELCALEPHISEPRPHVFKPYVYERHSSGSTLSEPLSLSLTPLNLALSSRSSDLTLSGLILSALYTFSTPPDPRLRNIHPVLATSVVRRVSKRASRRTYKDNVSGMKLGCRAIEIGAR